MSGTLKPKLTGCASATLVPVTQAVECERNLARVELDPRRRIHRHVEPEQVRVVGARGDDVLAVDDRGRQPWPGAVLGERQRGLPRPRTARRRFGARSRARAGAVLGRAARLQDGQQIARGIPEVDHAAERELAQLVDELHTAIAQLLYRDRHVVGFEAQLDFLSLLAGRHREQHEPGAVGREVHHERRVATTVRPIASR
jgi:hypothetical protein